MTEHTLLFSLTKSVNMLQDLIEVEMKHGNWEYFNKAMEALGSLKKTKTIVEEIVFIETIKAKQQLEAKISNEIDAVS